MNRPMWEDDEPGFFEGLVPPHDLQAEAAVIAACLLDGATIDLVAPLLEASDFYSDAHRLFWDALSDLRSAGTPADVITVVGWLRSRQLIARAGGPKYLGELLDATPAVANVAAHALIVRQRSRLRRVIAVCQKYAAEGYGRIDEAQEFLDLVETEIHSIVHAAEAQNSIRLRESLAKAFTKLADAAARGDTITGTSCGFVDLDQKTAGLHRGDLMIVAARPGMGKTSFVLNVAVNVATPTPNRPPLGAAIFSLEMPEEQLSQRMVCSEARVDLAKMRQNLLNHLDWEALTTAAGRLSALPIEIDDSPAISLLDLRSKARRIQSEMRREGVELGLVVVDYLQLMRTKASKYSNREQEISEISRGLKQLAKELGVPVIALSQLNRGVEARAGKSGKRPMLSDLRESGSLEQDADIVVLLYRDEYYNRDTQDRGIAELIIAKQRNGPTGTVRTRFISHCTRFEDLAPGDYEHG